MNYNEVSDDVPEGMSALEIAGVGQRLLAWLVDGIIAIVVIGAAFLIGLAIGDAGALLGILVWIVYVIVMLGLVATRGQSPGKMALNIRIVRVIVHADGSVRVDDNALGIGGMLIREIIGKFVSGLVIYLGFIWILFDSRRQGWHDKIASTYVVKV